MGGKVKKFAVSGWGCLTYVNRGKSVVKF